MINGISVVVISAYLTGVIVGFVALGDKVTFEKYSADQHKVSDWVKPFFWPGDAVLTAGRYIAQVIRNGR